MKVANVIQGYSQRTSTAAVKAKLDIHFLRTGRDLTKLKWQYRLQNMKRNETYKKSRKQDSGVMKRFQDLLSSREEQDTSS